jgi:signal transduction histidine kinase
MFYAMAILIVGAAAVAAHVLSGVAESAPFFLVAVAVSAWIGGAGPGLTAGGASLAAIALLYVLPSNSEHIKLVELLRILSLLPVALIIGVLHARKTRAEQALRERDARLQLVSQQIPGGLWATDADLRVTSGFGSQAGLLHGPPGSTLFDHFNTRDLNFAPISAHRRALRGESSSYEVEWGGRIFQSYVEPLRGIDRDIIGVVGVATDITAKKSAERERERLVRELETQHARLEAANHAKDRFLAMLSHELRTPLTPVMSLASSLAERNDLSPELREDCETILRNVTLEATLIDDLLDITRISRGKLQLHLSDVDVHDLLRNALQICGSDGLEKGVEVALELGAARHFVRGDAARLSQAFWNLIKNAIKFTPSGGKVVIHSQDLPGERLRVEVIDTGVGIAAQSMSRIFEAFEQGDSSVTRQFGGLGLGLAISKTLVQAHGGQIRAESDGPGRGARFTVELQAVQPVEALETKPGEGRGGAARRLKILLVDDHVDSARVIQKLLRADGHEVETATSVAGARRRLHDAGVDLLISDVGLPDGNGLDLMREAGGERAMRGIALSGYGSEDDVLRSLAAGFTAHLTKPVPISRLRQTIAEVSRVTA